MEALTLESEPQSDLCCDLCGYSRRGLAPDTRCPECGEPPPVIAKTADRLDVARSQGELNWLRCNAAGLFLLCLSSFCAIQVALIMPLGTLSISALNFPGPKVHAAVLLQRSIGNMPGPWGVDGTIASFFTAVAVWLLTERRSLQDAGEPLFSLRRLTRWVSLIGVGATAGILLAGLDVDGDNRPKMLVYSICLCELPANLLLYLHLRRLARQLNGRRAEKLLNFCAWAVPFILAGAVVLIGIDAAALELPGPSRKILSAAYRAAAVTTGAVATAGVFYLLLLTSVAGFGAWFMQWPGRTRQVFQLLRRASEIIDQDLGRWCVVLGILLWISLQPAMWNSAFAQRSTNGLLENVPMLNFPGPKLVSHRLSAGRDDDYFWATTDPTQTVWLNLLAIWMITCPFKNSHATPNRRRAARWVSTAAVALPMGILFGFTHVNVRHPIYLFVFTVLICEIPATLLVYFHLADLAADRPQLKEKIRRLAKAAAAIAAAPVVVLAITKLTHPLSESLFIAALSAIDVMLALGVGFIAIFTLLRLAWDVGRTGVAAPSPHQEVSHAPG